MKNNKRKLTLDVYDYSGNKLCQLFDNSSNIAQQASEVYIISERNGWKEIHFTLPCDDYRADYIKADYKIKAIDESGPDWYIITQPSYTHNGSVKTISVTAGHICQLLKTKNLALEFSDEYGNNVGTAAQLLSTVLNGTGWRVGEVSDFVEKDGSTIKRRSLKASSKTGAFKLITMIGELFECKPVFHGEQRTVDLLPMNPFSRPPNGDLYGAVTTYADGNVLELNYGRNVKNVTRSLNSEHLITKLYAYGAYGDETDGYCGIDECKHTEHCFTLTSSLTAGTTYYFSVSDDAGITTRRNFTPSVNVSSGATLTWSCLDPMSMMYIWNESTEKAYKVTDGQIGTQLPATYERKSAQNWFSFIMDFTYYDSIGLISDSILQTIARFQRKGANYLKTIHDSTEAYLNRWLELTQTIGDVDFVKLDIDSITSTTIDGNSYATINLTDDRIKYRTDFDAVNKFKWRVATRIKGNGDPINSEASVLYVIHNTSPTSYDKYYIKQFDNTDDPSTIVLWANAGSVVLSDTVYLFAYNGVTGTLGAYEAADESAKKSLDSATTVITVTHPVYYSTQQPAIKTPSQTDTTPSITVTVPEWATYNKTYAWWYNYGTGMLYFCYYANGDRTWYPVTISSAEPTYSAGSYWYNWHDVTLFKATDGDWVKFENTDDQQMILMFSTVYYGCLKRDQCRIGQYQTYSRNGTFVPNNWYMENEYGTLWLFTTQENATKFSYDTTSNNITITPSNVSHGEDVVESKATRRDTVRYHPFNIFSNASYEAGSISTSTGGDMDDETYQTYTRSSYVEVYPNLTYTFSGITDTITVYHYTSNHDFLSYASVNVPGSAYMPANTKYIRVVSQLNLDDLNAHIPDWNTAVIASNETYYSVGTPTGSGDKKGLIPCINKFCGLSDSVYITYLGQVKTAQENFNAFETSMQVAVGDMFREGTMQKNDYVDGDEDKLYDDALENLKNIAKPEATYRVDYLDLRGADMDAIEEDSLSWPEFDINSAAHLIDDDLGVNCWAYIDKVNKYYDQPWKTSVTINTNLSTASQHSFSDVLSNIATVASDVKASTTIYDRAAALSGSMKLATEKLEGKINANKLKIFGGSSTWYTDEKGNIVFESADGSAAMTLTGNGFAISSAKDKYGDWIWRTFGTGEGFTADEIVAGTMSAERLEAGSITTDKISSTFGETLDLSSNKGIRLMVSSIKSETLQEVQNMIGYRVDIHATAEVLSSDITTSTLTAYVFYGNEDITDEIPASKFKWSRSGHDATADAQWNAQHQGTKSVSISASEILHSATYTCEIEE